MDEAEIFAGVLAQRHRDRESFTLEAPAGRERDLEFAYAVQAALLGAAPVDGWKIGLTTPRMQQMCGVEEPIAGAVLEGRIHASPARIALADHVRLGLESEIALRIAHPLPDDPSPAEALACVDQVCAAFEMIDDSGADYGKLTAVTLVADNAWNAGLVLGPAATPPASLAGRRGVLSCDGALVDEGTSSDVLGDPANALAWLARRMASQGSALAPGQWVSTGSIVPTKFARPGQTWRFEVVGLPPVEAAIA